MSSLLGVANRRLSAWFGFPSLLLNAVPSCLVLGKRAVWTPVAKELMLFQSVWYRAPLGYLHMLGHLTCWSPFPSIHSSSILGISSHVIFLEMAKNYVSLTISYEANPGHRTDNSIKCLPLYTHVLPFNRYKNPWLFPVKTSQPNLFPSLHLPSSLKKKTASDRLITF